jgi:hypothetical protein
MEEINKNWSRVMMMEEVVGCEYRKNIERNFCKTLCSEFVGQGRGIVICKILCSEFVG